MVVDDECNIKSMQIGAQNSANKDVKTSCLVIKMALFAKG
jgi:hypothetical protein